MILYLSEKPYGNFYPDGWYLPQSQPGLEAQIGHLTIKQFLSSIETENELTAFFSHKVADAMVSRGVEFVIVYGTTCNTNIIDLDPELMVYNQEEADTGTIIFH